MTKIQTLREMRRILQGGDNIGDAAALKLTLTTKAEKPGPCTGAAIAMKRETFGTLDPRLLKNFPKESFGFAYYRFMEQYDLKPLNFSAEVEPLYDRYPVALRYTRVHDLVHVLLGFEPNAPGEVGVYAFIRKQNYSSLLNRAATVAKVGGYLMFWKRTEMRAAICRAEYLAKDARILIVEPLESMIEQPLIDVRQALLPRWNGE